MLVGRSHNDDIFKSDYTPSKKMAIKSLLVEQNKKFQCLKLSTAKDIKGY